MRTITCIGYEGHSCGKVVQPTSGRQKRCVDCAREQHRETSRKWWAVHLEHHRGNNQKWYAAHIEEASVRSHWCSIFNPKDTSHRNYKGVPFFDGWNPDKGGSFHAGADWIIKNLGKRPTDGKYELHIIDRQIGFVPGNLMWVPKDRHKREELLAKSLKRIQELESLVRAA